MSSQSCAVLGSTQESVNDEVSVGAVRPVLWCFESAFERTDKGNVLLSYLNNSRVRYTHRSTRAVALSMITATPLGSFLWSVACAKICQIVIAECQRYYLLASHQNFVMALLCLHLVDQSIVFTMTPPSSNAGPVQRPLPAPLVKSVTRKKNKEHLVICKTTRAHGGGSARTSRLETYRPTP